MKRLLVTAVLALSAPSVHAGPVKTPAEPDRIAFEFVDGTYRAGGKDSNDVFDMRRVK
jgi:hypothetical protein